jgi:hypothetical protein
MCSLVFLFGKEHTKYRFKYVVMKNNVNRRWPHHQGDRPDDGGSKDLRNVGKLLPDYMALQLRRQSLHTHRRENLESYLI